MGNWFAAAAAGVLALFGASSTGDHHFPPPHDGTSTGEHQRFDRHASSTPQIDFTCVSAAVATREAALDTAVSTHTTDINAAYTTRASALASAYSQTGNDAIKKAVRTAWAQFGAALKLSKKNWQKAKDAAWQSFRTAAKACGGNASALSDGGNAGQEFNQ